ncbi:hypothetical protein F0562_031591 [Nyssa sinensis]|uniref:Uncharacterized protein n=1 Tax=Nyssa sinensis TaxID=561372 RepID=A0A5J5AWN1_9ASTE|nr:hypothetical protein F0562_031591 [Nyssa sinensis]
MSPRLPRGSRTSGPEGTVRRTNHSVQGETKGTVLQYDPEYHKSDSSQDMVVVVVDHREADACLERGARTVTNSRANGMQEDWTTGCTTVGMAVPEEIADIGLQLQSQIGKFWDPLEAMSAIVKAVALQQMKNKNGGSKLKAKW